MEVIRCVGCWFWNLGVRLQKQNGDIINLSGLWFQLKG